MVRTGIERSQEPALRRVLRESKSGQLRAAGIGAGIAVLLQSSTAVAMLAAGFAASGVLTVQTGLALMLGADLGSALVVQILSFDLSLLVPVLLLAGGLMFFKGPSRDTRQAGRVLIGIALILISLQMIGQATEPLRDSTMLPTVVGYLRGDFITAFLIGAAFTWLVHSSVASILLIAAFAAQGLVPAELGVSLLLGANLGGGLIAVGLTRASFVEARRIAWGNLTFRGTGALVVLFAFHLLDPAIDWLGADAARQIVNLHLLFNGALIVICLPLTGPVTRVVERLVKPKPTLEQQLNPLAASASATRELLRMAEIIERMLKPLMELYETGDPEKIKQARQLERAVDQAQSEIKLYLAKINYGGDATDEAQRGRELTNFAINLEYVGDAISKTLLRLAEVRRDQKLQFSPAGWRELNDLHHQVMANMQLALNVLVSEDRESARQLLHEKDRMRSAERASYGEHMKRLQSGAAESIETSNIHLETVRALKTINSLFASVAYPILARSGDLLDSRLASEGTI